MEAEDEALILVIALDLTADAEDDEMLQPSEGFTKEMLHHTLSSAEEVLVTGLLDQEGGLANKCTVLSVCVVNGASVEVSLTRGFHYASAYPP